MTRRDILQVMVVISLTIPILVSLICMQDVMQLFFQIICVVMAGRLM
jgi:hypothetical protein